LARQDDESRRSKISSARKIIYSQGYAVNSAPVETILKEQSLVPIAASTLLTTYVHYPHYPTECVFGKAEPYGL